MPTQFRRIQITIDPELNDVLSELAGLTGKPIATILRSWLREAVPHIAEALAAEQMARTAPKKAAARMATLSEGLVREVRQLAMPLKQKAGRPRKRG
jgi:predicted DNA-binding protein